MPQSDDSAGTAELPAGATGTDPALDPLHEALSAGGVGAVHYDFRTTTLTASPVVAELVGGPVTSLRDVLEFVDERDQGFLAERLRGLVASARDARESLDFRVSSTDGTLRWLRFSCRMTFEGGRPARLAGTLQDVSDVHREQELAEQSHRWFRRIAETTPNIIFVYDLVHQRSIYSSKSLHHVLGYTNAEFGAIEQILSNVIAPDDLAETAAFYEDMRNASPGEVRVLTHRTLHKDGSIRWLHNSVTPFSYDASGKVSEVIGISTDVTEQYAAEAERERLVAFIEHSSDFIATADINGRLKYMNAAGRRMIGLPADSDVGGLEITDYVPADWIDEFRSKIIPAVRETGAWYGEMQLQHLVTGERIDVARSTYLIRDRQSGEPTGFGTVTRDITAARRAERLAREHEERFRVLGEAIPAIAFILHSDGSGGYANSRWEEYTGLTFAEVQGNGRAVVHPDDYPHVFDRWTRSMETGEPFESEYRLRRKDGQYRWHLGRGVPLRDSAGNVAWCVTLTDVHDMKVVQDELRRSEELVRTIAENSTQALSMMDDRGYCTYANRAALAMTGYSADEISSRPLHDLIHHHYPDGRPFPMQECPIDRALPENFDLRAHEDLFFRKDGTSFPVLVAASPIFRDGRPVSTVIEIRDVTAARAAQEALRESEQRFRHLANNAPVMIWVTDQDGSCSFLSESWAKFTGQHADSGLGFGWLEAVHPDDRDSARDAFLRAHRGRTPFLAEFRLRSAEGDYVWALDSAMPHLSASGEFLGYIGSVIDISDRKRAEDVLVSSAEALREADRLKDEFLATLSHELRTPLTAIVGWAHMLKSGVLAPAEAALAIDTISRSAQIQSDLIEDVLDISRITAGKMRLSRRPADPVAIAMSALSTISPAAEARGINIRVELDETIGTMVVDPDRLQQILWNLLSNAIKFSEPQSNVDFTMRRQSSSAVFEVRDYGPGIRAEFLPHVFERFRQADSSSRRSYAGLGLGLALVKDLTNLHGGSVSVESEEGRGATFTVILPIVTSLDSPEQPAMRAPDGAPLQGLSVLVVDDQPDARLLISTMLRTLGATPTDAVSVDAALRALTGWRPDAIITDIAMPQRDGYDLLAAVREQVSLNGVPVVALTAQVAPEEHLRATAAGFSAYLQKPVEPAQLGSTLAKVARR